MIVEKIKMELMLYFQEVNKRNVQQARIAEIKERVKVLAEELDNINGFKYAQNLIKDPLEKEVAYPKRGVSRAVKGLLNYISVLEHKTDLCNSGDLVTASKQKKAK